MTSLIDLTSVKRMDNSLPDNRLAGNGADNGADSGFDESFFEFQLSKKSDRPSRKPSDDRAENFPAPRMELDEDFVRNYQRFVGSAVENQSPWRSPSDFGVYSSSWMPSFWSHFVVKLGVLGSILFVIALVIGVLNEQRNTQIAQATGGSSDTAANPKGPQTPVQPAPEQAVVTQPEMITAAVAVANPIAYDSVSVPMIRSAAAPDLSGSAGSARLLPQAAPAAPSFSPSNAIVQSPGQLPSAGSKVAGSGDQVTPARQIQPSGQTRGANPLQSQAQPNSRQDQAQLPSQPQTTGAKLAPLVSLESITPKVSVAPKASPQRVAANLPGAPNARVTSRAVESTISDILIPRRIAQMTATASTQRVQPVLESVQANSNSANLGALDLALLQQTPAELLRLEAEALMPDVAQALQANLNLLPEAQPSLSQPATVATVDTVATEFQASPQVNPNYSGTSPVAVRSMQSLQFASLQSE